MAQLVWIVVAIVAARFAAMAWNRYLDRDIDARNERTAQREIPRGALTPGAVLVSVIISGALFISASFALGLHCGVLSPFVLMALLSYSYLKRVTSSVHLYLGLCLALAPGGAWYAVTAELSWIPVPLMCGVLFWVAGFDILYSLQDEDFDRAAQLYSIPRALGGSRAIVCAFVLHLVSLLFFAWFALIVGLQFWFWVIFALFATVLLSQYRVVLRRDISLISREFFTKNGMASVIFLGAVLLGC
jgi:4-hydroxybenzoate polyprenyltransferase